MVVKFEGDSLFYNKELRELHQYLINDLVKEINDYNNEEFIGSDEEELLTYFKAKYFIQNASLNKEALEITQDEDEVDISKDPAAFTTSSPYYVQATRINYHIPIEGNVDLFNYQGSSWPSPHPQGEISGNELIISISSNQSEREVFQEEFKKVMKSTEQLLGEVNNGVDSLNHALEQTIKQQIQQKREKIKRDTSLVESLGYPLRKSNQVKEGAFPFKLKKKSLNIIKPRPKKENSDPFLKVEDYDEILSILMNMSYVIEKNPSAFHGLDEETIRNHFLIQLNGAYDGRAVGEAFNCEGKTDILISDNGRNIFIAECKFWKGAKAFSETIDQLLGYVSWRDNKTAILVFNKNKDSSNVVQQIPDLVKEHNSFVEEEKYDFESGSRYILKNNQDENKHMYLTVLVFDLSF